MKKHYRHETDCLNCGTTLEGKFCHNCGQENLEMKESFGHMMNHAISDYFHFDYQFFHTLKPLFFQPGKLTNEYMAGHRVQYLHPVKMYIFISLIYFLLLFKTNSVVNFESKPVTTEQINKKIGISIDQDNGLSASQKAELKRAIIDSAKGNSKIKARYNDTAFSDGIININADTSDFANRPKTYNDYLVKQSKLPANKRDNFFSRYMAKKSYSWRAQGKNAKEEFMTEFEHNTSKMMFLLLPVFALILSVAFYKNKKYYVEHLIYAFHYHCFVFLFLTIIMLIQLLIPNSWGLTEWMYGLAGLVIIWYTYRSFRMVYHRSAIRTITKMMGIALAYLFAFSICITAVALITALIAV